MIVTFRLQMDFPPQAIDEAIHALRSLIGPVRAEPGCTATRLLEELQEGRAVVFLEEWRDMAHLQRHLYAPTFRKLLAVMELAGAVPTVEIDEVSSRRGFDLVEEVLSLHPPGAAAGERDETSGRHPR